MLRKLLSLVSGSCCADNPDSPQHQEVLLPGTLYGMIIKERLEEILNNIRGNINAEARTGAVLDFNDRTHCIINIRQEPSHLCDRKMVSKNA
jgi:DNA-directed RNA polymerase I subunit RPA2